MKKTIKLFLGATAVVAISAGVAGFTASCMMQPLLSLIENTVLHQANKNRLSKSDTRYKNFHFGKLFTPLKNLHH